MEKVSDLSRSLQITHVRYAYTHLIRAAISTRTRNTRVCSPRESARELTEKDRHLIDGEFGVSGDFGDRNELKFSRFSIYFIFRNPSLTQHVLQEFKKLSNPRLSIETLSSLSRPFAEGA